VFDLLEAGVGLCNVADDFLVCGRVDVSFHNHACAVQNKISGEQGKA
jgi:hypothetical protein